MSILTTISRLASDYRARRRRLETYLEITALPPEIRKDIGWPGGAADRDARRRSVTLR